MQKYITSTFLLLVSFYLTAQTYQEISVGAGYNKQSFIRLSDGSQKQVNNDSWDIAFTAFGFQDAGIFINESSGSSMGQNLPLAELFYTLTDDFSLPVNLDAIKDYKYLNSEVSWNYGAFNETRDTLNPFDYGWGQYQPATNRVIGEKVFVLKLRNGEYRKIKIENLTGTTYTFRYAKLDGSNEITKTLNKQADNKGQKLIFFSFTTNNTVDVLPAGGFDLMYCRYVSIAKDFNGTLIQQYNVTGVLTGPGVLTARADGVNPATVSYNDYKNKLSSLTDVIGYDWKTFTGTSWVLDLTRVFFVKTTDNKVWKIRFIDFEGSATGNAVFEKTELGTSLVSELAGVNTGVFPNPVEDELIITIAAESKPEPLNIEISDANGKKFFLKNIGSNTDFNVINVNTSEWKKGIYFLRISNSNNESTIRKVIKL
jgi:hypothetical protein